MTPAVPGRNNQETRDVSIDADGNTAGENSSQAVACQTHNITSVTCCDQRIALLLATVILIIAGVALGLGFGLSSKSSHDPSTTVPSTPSVSSLTPTPTTTSAFEVSSIKQVTPSSSSTSATNSTRLPPPSPSPKADGVHLVFYRNGTTQCSGFAYYRSAQQGNQGALPDDFTVANVDINSQWEGFNTTGYFANTGITFWASINQTISSVNEAVGIASNGYHSFRVYKDDERTSKGEVSRVFRLIGIGGKR
ncbi:MAG: hypothetical protein Q9203_004026 [Teloschistes exilis]